MTTYPDQSVPGINRREFLSYIGGASLALFSASICALFYKFASGQISAIPFNESTVYPLDLNLLENIRLPVTAPIRVVEAQTWLVPTETGLIAFSEYCPFRGCRFKWVQINKRFECPCFGSKFQLDGTYIAGPAKRNLDRNTIWVLPGEVLRTPEDGSPVPIENARNIYIDTWRIIRGQQRD